MSDWTNHKDLCKALTLTSSTPKDNRRKEEKDEGKVTPAVVASDDGESLEDSWARMQKSSTARPMDVSYSMTKEKETTAVSTSPPHTTNVNTGFLQKKSLGGKYFKGGKFESAVKCYTKAIFLATDPNDKLIALSNRAQCYLNLLAFPEALVDADSALDIDKSHVKSLVRKVTAHIWLRQPSLAVAACAGVEEKDSHLFLPLIEAAKRTAFEMKGKYDRDAMLASKQGDGCLKDIHLDYAHPSYEIVMIENKGRGVIATSDIKPGTLLLVSTK